MADVLGPIWILLVIISVVLAIIDFANHHNHITFTRWSALISIATIVGALFLGSESFIPLIISLVLFSYPLYNQLSHSKQVNQKATEKLVKEGKLIDFNTTRKFGELLVDDEKHYFKLGRGGNTESAFPISALIDATIVETPGKSVTKGPHRITRGLVGGAIAGTAGAVIGAASGKSTSYPSVRSLYVTISTTYATLRVTFIHSNTKTDSFVYRTLRASAEQTLTGFKVLMSESEK